MNKKVYKVLRNMHSNVRHDYSVQYSLTELNKPIIGKLFVFDTLEHASNYALKSDEIYECLGYGVKAISLCLFVTRLTSSNIKALHKGDFKKLENLEQEVGRAVTTDVLLGTMTCTSLKILKKMK